MCFKSSHQVSRTINYVVALQKFTCMWCGKYIYTMVVARYSSVESSYLWMIITVHNHKCVVCNRKLANHFQNLEPDWKLVLSYLNNAKLFNLFSVAILSWVWNGTDLIIFLPDYSVTMRILERIFYMYVHTNTYIQITCLQESFFCKVKEDII